MLSLIAVKGELSNVKYHSSGHIYFTIKDSRAALSGVMFSSDALSLSFRLEEGQSVVVTGRIGVFERDGKYQIYAREISLTGAGALYEQFERLKARLEEMGMFSEEYKRAIPAYVKKLGVVTAPTGAAVRDMIHVARRRNPYIDILLFPAKVQGEGAAESIAEGIATLSESDADVIIVGRGGGSIEDLWAFNEEIVARAIFDCPIPVISGTGHETDFTIADFVADLRAATPSAAAELAVFDFEIFKGKLWDYRQELSLLMEQRLRRLRERSREREETIKRLSPTAKMRERRLRLIGYEASITDSMERRLAEARSRLSVLSERLEGLSPLHSLNRGYAYVQDAEGRALKDVDRVKKGDSLTINLKNGRIYADVTGKKRNH